jgi:hypothetical protein
MMLDGESIPGTDVPKLPFFPIDYCGNSNDPVMADHRAY